jgi:hypothetical protein
MQTSSTFKTKKLSIFSVANLLPEDLSIFIWKDIFTSNVVRKIEKNSCSICGRFMKKKYKNMCFSCLVTRFPCMCCLTPALQNEQVLEVEPAFDGSFLVLLKQNKKDGSEKWWTEGILYERQLLQSYYRCFYCIVKAM